MALLSAGQFMESGEIAALYAAIGKGGTATAYTTSYLALATNAASGSVNSTWLLFSSGITVPTDASYAAQPITTSSGWSTPTAASPSVVSNAAVITWGPWAANASATLTWGFLASSASNTTAIPLIAYLLTTPRSPLLGDSVSAAIGAFTAQV